MRDFSALNFFRRSDAGQHHSMLCRFVLGSYLRHQDSSSEAIQFKKFGVASAVGQNPMRPLNVSASDRQLSDEAQDDNTFFLIPKFWVTICRMYSRLICSSLAIMGTDN
ncbi:hypothetical protein TNCV_2746031 [Trichonephila clavipes]|nr:hypothetical protein TNCV_2746031 [Trichonephila clavipes]